jgi:hypothetical protein
MSNETNEVFSAFSLFQSEVEDVKRDSQSLKGKYAKIEQVLQVARKILASHGLGISQLIGDCSGEYVEIETIILHKSGQFFSKKMRLATGNIMLNSQGKETLNRAQFCGLNISYARRYGLLSILGMAQEDEDNDAEIPHQRNNYNNNQRPYQQESKDIDIMNVLIKQINDLITGYKIPQEKVDAWKSHYKVDDLSKLSEMQARSIVNKVRSEMTMPVPEYRAADSYREYKPCRSMSITKELSNE